MSLLSRIAIALGATLLLSAVAATFLPAEPDGVEGCGSWVAPGMTDDEFEALGEDYVDLYDRGSAFGMGSEIYASAERVVMAKRACDDALGSRRTASLILLGGAIFVPGGIPFAGRRRDAQALVA